MISRNFRNLISTRLILNLIDSLIYMVIIWYAAKISARLEALLLLAFTIPQSLSIFFGPLIDRYSYKKVLFISISSQFVLMAVMTILYTSNVLSLWITFIVVFLISLAGNIGYNVEEAIVPNIVNNDEIVKANSIMEITYSIFDSIFNGIGGLLVIIFTVSQLYIISTLLFILPLFFISKLVLVNNKIDNIECYTFDEYKIDLKEGIKSVFDGDIKKLIIPLVIINLFYSMTTITIPYFSSGINDTAALFGGILLLKGASGIIGAGVPAILDKFFTTKKSIAISLFLQGILWIGLILFRQNDFLMLSLYFTSFIFFGATNILFTSLFQKNLSKDKFGRAFTAIDTFITLAMPIGYLLAGELIEQGINIFVIMLPYGIISALVGVYYFITKINT